jgi:glycosyltransferase involved in cell wall biosynthesis
MRILLMSGHRYPADDGLSRHPRPHPSGAPFVVHDLLARALAKLGHHVLYLLEKGAASAPPEGIEIITKPTHDVDIFHNYEDIARPWVKTQHRFADELEGATPPDNWIFVSQSLARSHGKSRVVMNGVDPDNFTYSETKQDYFLFLAGMQGPRNPTAYWGKGLDTALSLSKSIGFKLLVAGTAIDHEVIDTVSEMCREAGAEYLGDVRSAGKADLLAGAKALLFPTRLNEGCPLVLAEALMSGTPIIASRQGPCPELVTPDVGFACAGQKEYEAAIENIRDISPKACREKAMSSFHYMKMAADYVVEYEKELGTTWRSASV